MGALRSLVRPLRSSVSGRAAVICLPVNFKRDYAAHRRRARKSRACVSTGAVARAVSITADMQRGPAASRLRAGLDRRLSDLPAQCIVCTVLLPANIQTAAAGGDGSISRVAVYLTH